MASRSFRDRIHSKATPTIIRVESQRGETSTLDTWLGRAANLSQPLLLALGVFGYFYTVLPVFQNQQLQEESARLQLENAAALRELTAAKKQQALVVEETRVLQESLKGERLRSTQLASGMKAMEQREAVARQAAVAAEQSLRSQLDALEHARWELVMLDVQLAQVAPRLTSIAAWYGDSAVENFMSEAESTWPRPYEDLLAAVDLAKNKNQSQGADIPVRYYAELKTLIEERKAELACGKPDFARMHQEYLAEVSTLPPATDAEVARYIQGIEDEYAAKKQRVRITDELRRRSRQMIEVRGKVELKMRYYERIHEEWQACTSRADNVLSQIGRLKGATR